jgi:hypothetical protein
MLLLKRIFILLPIIVLSSGKVTGIENPDFKIQSRLSFYSVEKEGEILLYFSRKYLNENLIVRIRQDDKLICEQTGKPGQDIVRIPFNITGEIHSGKIDAEIIISGRQEQTFQLSCDLVILHHKPNEVKTDRLTGGLIVNNRPFFPVGFYCYSPVHPSLPEEEVVRGFNVISPYQKIMPETIDERKAYMDRCAQLGMKVHYNLISVSGGGGVNSEIEESDEVEKGKLLVQEIRAFMDHPALLAWYIADEPNGHKLPPDKLAEIYKKVRETDPWHPVSVVFMAPFNIAKDYAGSFDIVMADPYPVPDYPVTMCGDVTRLLKKDFSGENPVWIVPQAFGGGELWRREPTIQEVRSMTWQSVIEGATGIQYFVRRGLNSFPKSVATWGECGRIAMEIKSLSPWLLSDEGTVPVFSPSKNILVTARLHRGVLAIMTVNKTNEPLKASIGFQRSFTGQAEVLFENRTVKVYSGSFSDFFQAYGSQVYMIKLETKTDSIKPWTGNLITDPGFEDNSSPGVPASCYIRSGSDRGSNYFLDPSEHAEGDYSLMINTPAENKGITVRFFPIKVNAGSSYLVTVWAKADPEQRFLPETDGIIHTTKPQSPQYVEIGLGDFGKGRFVPESNWKQFVTTVTIPSDTVPELKTNVILTMPGQGVAWFDMLQVIEDPLKR